MMPRFLAQAGGDGISMALVFLALLAGVGGAAAALYFLSRRKALTQAQVEPVAAPGAPRASERHGPLLEELERTRAALAERDITLRLARAEATRLASDLAETTAEHQREMGELRAALESEREERRTDAKRSQQHQEASLRTLRAASEDAVKQRAALEAQLQRLQLDAQASPARAGAAATPDHVLEAARRQAAAARDGLERERAETARLTRALEEARADLARTSALADELERARKRAEEADDVRARAVAEARLAQAKLAEAQDAAVASEDATRDATSRAARLEAALAELRGDPAGPRLDELEAAREQAAAAQAALERERAETSRLARALEDARADLSSAGGGSEDVERARRQVEAVEAERGRAVADARAAEARLADTHEHARAAEAMASEAITRTGRLEADLATTRASLKEARAGRTSAGASSEGDADLRAALDQVAALEERVRRLSAALAAVRARLPPETRGSSFSPVDTK